MKKTCILCGHVKASHLATAEAGSVLTLRWWHDPSSRLADTENTPVPSSAFKRLQQVGNRGEQSYAIQELKISWLGHCAAACGLNLKYYSNAILCPDFERVLCAEAALLSIVYLACLQGSDTICKIPRWENITCSLYILLIPDWKRSRDSCKEKRSWLCISST